jgi:hypothetical protein
MRPETACSFTLRRPSADRILRHLMMGLLSTARPSSRSPLRFAAVLTGNGPNRRWLFGFSRPGFCSLSPGGGCSRQGSCTTANLDRFRLRGACGGARGPAVRDPVHETSRDSPPPVRRGGDRARVRGDRRALAAGLGPGAPPERHRPGRMGLRRLPRGGGAVRDDRTPSLLRLHGRHLPPGGLGAQPGDHGRPLTLLQLPLPGQRSGGHRGHARLRVPADRAPRVSRHAVRGRGPERLAGGGGPGPQPQVLVGCGEGRRRRGDCDRGGARRADGRALCAVPHRPGQHGYGARVGAPAHALPRQRRLHVRGHPGWLPRRDVRGLRALPPLVEAGNRRRPSRAAAAARSSPSRHVSGMDPTAAAPLPEEPSARARIVLFPRAFISSPVPHRPLVAHTRAWPAA